MTTFSQLVDKMVAETKRPDLKSEISTYLNQTLRELHFEPERGKVVFLRDNLKENQIATTMEQGQSWELPNPSVFQGLQAARFDSVYKDCQQVYAEEVSIGRGMQTRPYNWYRSGARVFFSGYGGTGTTISLAWYEYVPGLRYYESGTRPAIYDIVDGWTYAPIYDVNDATRLQAQMMVTNWILMRWDTVVEEGVRAKIYKRMSDTERARTSYSMYSTLRAGFISSEEAVISGAW